MYWRIHLQPVFILIYYFFKIITRKTSRFVRKKCKSPRYLHHLSPPLILPGSFYFKNLFMHYNAAKEETPPSTTHKLYIYIFTRSYVVCARLSVMYALCCWKFYLANNFTASWPFVNVGFCNLPHPSHQVSGQQHNSRVPQHEGMKCLLMVGEGRQRSRWKWRQRMHCYLVCCVNQVYL